MSYMYMHCFFKFDIHDDPHINSLTLKIENTKMLTGIYSTTQIYVNCADTFYTHIRVWLYAHMRTVARKSSHHHLSSLRHGTHKARKYT